MNKADFLLHKIKGLDVPNMLSIARSVSRKSSRNFAVTVADMIYCGIKYQAGYYDYQEFEFYGLDRAQRETYLTSGKNNQIIAKYNDPAYNHTFKYKDEFYTRFSSFIGREWMQLDGYNKDEFMDFLKRNGSIIAKPADGQGGHGIEKITYTDDDKAASAYYILFNNNSRIIEQCIVQHPEMSNLYDGSVNSIRMYTLYQDGKAYFLQAILKIGNGGVVDNFSSGGMYAFLDDSGVVTVPAIDRLDRSYTIHPVSGTEIQGFKVPLFDEAVKLVCEAASVVPQVGYIGWDVAISDKGPCIIEGNYYPGIFQPKASHSKDKTGLIPKYNEIMHLF